MTDPALRLLAIGLGPVSVGPTPLAILITCLLVAVVLLAVLVLGSQVGGALVDRRWPANQPLTPSEVLWGESGAHVRKTFPGLDPTIARDLTQYVSTRKVPAGTTLVEAGDLPTTFMLLKSGAAQVGGAGGGKVLKPGDSVGGENIISRTPHTATVTTTAPSEVVSLGAEDYLAAMALGMSDDDDDYVVNVLGAYFDDDRQASVAVAGTPPAAPAAPAPAPPAPQRVVAPPPPPWPAATHRVGAPELPGYVLPAGDRPTRTLVAGEQVEQLESLPGWVHVRTADGWQGWVAEQGLVRQR